MNNSNNKDYIEDAIKSDTGINQKNKEIERIIDEIYKTGEELNIVENEFLELMKKMINNRENKENKENKKIKIEKDLETLKDIKDPRELYFDKKEDEEKIKKILNSLKKLHEEKPERLLVSIFYDRYVKKLKTEEIARNYGLTKDTIYGRIAEIVRYVNN